MIMMMIIMMLMRMMTMMQMMKHCEGLLREETRKACDENSLEGGMELDIQSRAEISGSEKRAPPRYPWMLIT